MRNGSQVRQARAFTIIELMIVMAVIALLASVVTPRYFKHVERAKESTLRQNLFATRDAIDKYFSDTGKYPETLQALVDAHYLRALPEDPISGRNDAWLIVAPANADLGAVYDLHSAAQDTSSDGSRYANW